MFDLFLLEEKWGTKFSGHDIAAGLWKSAYDYPVSPFLELAPERNRSAGWGGARRWESFPGPVRGG